MSGKSNAFNVNDFTSHDDAEDENDLGNELTDDNLDEEDESKAKKPEDDKGKKSPAKKAPAKKEESAEEEEEEDDEEEEEEDDEEEEEEDAGKPKKSEAELKLEKKLSRTAKAREGLENQVRELQKQLDQNRQTQTDASKAKFDKMMEELDGLYEDVEKFRAEGKTGEAAKAQRRIDEIRDGMTRAQAAAAATKTALEQAETRAYNTMVKELELLDSRFDPDSDDFEQELLDDVAELVESYEAKGLPLTDALRKACKVLLREDLFAKGRSLKREDKKKDEGEKPKPRKTDVDKNLKAAKKTPPEAPGNNKEKANAEVDMSNISEKDFANLPESTLRRYLGDEV